LTNPEENTIHSPDYEESQEILDTALQLKLQVEKSFRDETLLKVEATFQKTTNLGRTAIEEIGDPERMRAISSVFCRGNLEMLD
jgi:hypothetical protein